MCSLFSHLAARKHLAEAQRNTAEVARLETEIQDHTDRCVTCAGLQLAPAWMRELFNFRTVIIVKE